MTAVRLLRRAALASLTLLLAGCADQAAPTQEASTVDGGTTPIALAAGGGTTLAFNGVDANASLAPGRVISTQIDSMEISLDLRYDGPNADHSHQTVYYSGITYLNGWGIILLSDADGMPDGSLCILAGANALPCSPWTLTPGVWHHLTAQRVDQVVTVTMDGQSWDAGVLPVNRLSGRGAGELTTVGGDGSFDAPAGSLNGAIDRLDLRDLAGKKWIERWNFNAGEGTTATGVNGNVLQLGNAQWARRGGH